MCCSTPCICLAPTERRLERGVHAASTHDCQQAPDCSNALLLSTLKRRERRAPLNTYEERGETFARALVIRPSLVVVGFRNESQRSGDGNGNFRIFERRTTALPLLGERVGVRENEANSNPRRTTIPGTLKLRESSARAGGFQHLV